VRYEGDHRRLALLRDTIRVDSIAVRSDRGRAVVSGFVRLEQLARLGAALDITAGYFQALDLKQNVADERRAVRLALTGPVIGATLTGRRPSTSGVLYFADLPAEAHREPGRARGYGR